MSLIALALLLAPLDDPSTHYAWLKTETQFSIQKSYDVPSNYTRVPVKDGSFSAWLRQLPLKPDSAKVLTYAGDSVWYQLQADRVVDIDVGKRDLQQCADVLLRLKAEYHFSRGEIDKLTFHFTSGDKYSYQSWLNGIRPVVRGSTVTWKTVAKSKISHRNFRKWLDVVFTYAGTVSLLQETKKITDITDIKIGDILLDPGFPGHTIMVVDVARNSDGKQKVMFVQGSTPAQSPHIITRGFVFDRSVWYPINKSGTIKTPIWNFESDQLRRFK